MNIDIDALVLFVMTWAAVAVASVALLHVFVQVRVWLQMRTLHTLLVGTTPKTKTFAALSKDKKRELVGRALQLAVAAVNRVEILAHENDITCEITPGMKGKRDGSSVRFVLTASVLGEGACMCPSCTVKRMAERAGMDAGDINFEMVGSEGHRSVH